MPQASRRKAIHAQAHALTPVVVIHSGCVCTFLRIGWIHYLTKATITYLVTSKGIMLMSVIEVSIGLVCVSLATYRPLFRSLGSLSRNRSYYHYYYGNDSRGAPDDDYIVEGTMTATSMSLINHKGQKPVLTVYETDKV